MSDNTLIDTRSAWYEVLTRASEVRVTTESEMEPSPARLQPADDDWVAEAIFSVYND